VIANDTDSKRAYMLTHQARRLNSPALLVTNNDARRIPHLKTDKNNNTLKFDRILCDVPCSGDGTLRKNMTLWKNFNSHLGHAMHPLQLEILEKGFSLLKKGGRLVYSTCTFNPIEDEAVVAAALSRHIKQIELVDVSKEVSPHLKYRQGMINWEVYHRGKGRFHGPQFYQSFKDVPDFKQKVIKETMFTETYTLFNNEPDREASQKYDPLNLKRCMRIYPHDANQGGFFVAVFTKVLDDKEGLVYDELYEMNAWDDPNVRQKPILEDLREFAEEYEADLRRYEQEHGVPPEKSSQNEILKLVEEAEEESRKRKAAVGISSG
jgi:16S rRNA C967 or C1407 C5-methylase (RsmB/RsmF family)